MSIGPRASASGTVISIASPPNSVRLFSGSSVEVKRRMEAIGNERATSCSFTPLATRVVAPKRARWTLARQIPGRDPVDSRTAMRALGGHGTRLRTAPGAEARNEPREEIAEAQEQSHELWRGGGHE